MFAPLSSRRLSIPACVLLLTVASCRSPEALPGPDTPAYREAVAAFYTGLAAIQASEDLGAEDNFRRVTELAPGEPAAWANLGLLALRRNAFDAAQEQLERAHTLAPDNGQIEMLRGLLASTQGRLEESVAHLRRAVEQDPRNLKALYALARELERQGTPQGAAEAQRLYERILEVQPGNLAALLERARLAARDSNADTLGQTVARLKELAASWPPEAQEQLRALEEAAAASDFNRAATQVVFLRNVLVSVPAFRQSLAAVQTPAEQVGELITHFLRLPSPTPTPAPPDEALTFGEDRQLTPPGARPAAWAGAVSLTGDGPPAIVLADGRRVQVGDAELAFPGGPSAAPPSRNGIAAFDANYDFRTDLALAGAGGLRLFLQDSTGTFTDVTARTGLPASMTRAAYTGAWAADLDLEGDLDLVLATPAGSPLVLRNNGDSTFTTLRLFEDVTGLHDFAWADLDADGDPDAAFLDTAGRLHVVANERLGQFRPLPSPERASRVLAFTIADVDSDGLLDLVAFQDDGSIHRLSLRPNEPAWQTAELARWPDYADTTSAATTRLFAADLDNNGGFDLVVSTPAGERVWLSDTEGTFHPLATPLDVPIFSTADLTEDGRLDLLGLSPEGQPVGLINQGVKNYHWKTVRPRAAHATGDQRINAFGIGGEIEVRSGLLFQKQPITAPIVHFGLGEHTRADLVRIIWPNGTVQAEFDLEADQAALAQQRLKGSCPWVFTHDGSGMQFVTDFLWRSPLGLRINAQETAGVMMTEDRVKIRGDQLAARDGYYDVRITAELWETHFFDHVSLLVVDHPEETDIFVDERFAFPPPDLAVHTTAPPRPVQRAWDDQGTDVTSVVRARDERYLDTFGRGAYQGVTRDHYVEIELGEAVPSDGPLWLLASGWIRPTDSSINVAISQGRHPAPRGLSLEVPDGRGGWRVARNDLGFPAGKSKTILIDLDGLFLPDAPRRLRLRTNLEIYWDAFAWAAGRPHAEIRTQRLQPETAELRYRGFSTVHEADRSSPELPDYEMLAGTAPRWRDLIGYYTRFGDVRPLLADIDDRYVIMNAGDELRFRFPAPPPPPEGWVRDFVLIGDGWVKDGDYNTAFSKTILPLPAHDRPDYTTPPARLQDDPVYRRHGQDWQQYHTRYVTPQRFQNALTF